MLRGSCNIFAEDDVASHAQEVNPLGAPFLLTLTRPAGFELDYHSGLLHFFWFESECQNGDDDGGGSQKLTPSPRLLEASVYAPQWTAFFKEYRKSSEHAHLLSRSLHLIDAGPNASTPPQRARRTWAQLGKAAAVLGAWTIRLAFDPINPSQFYDRTRTAGDRTAELRGEPTLQAFPRQENSFKYCDENKSTSLKCFSFESANLGKRRFIAVGPQEFITRYLDIPPKERHVYEIIREGHPCRGYFDIEFSRESNPDIDGDALVRRLVSMICWKFYDLYGFELDERDFINLDSSNSTKFSQHLIMNIVRPLSNPNMDTSSCGDKYNSHQIISSEVDFIERLQYGNHESNYLVCIRVNDGAEFLFPDNSHVGSFVSRLISDMLENSASSSERFEGGVCPKSYFSDFWVWDRDHKTRSNIVDLCVYSRNRAFRLLLSSKYGKETILSVNPNHNYNHRIRKMYRDRAGRYNDRRDRMEIALSLSAVVPFGITLHRLNELNQCSKNIATAPYFAFDGLYSPSTLPNDRANIRYLSRIRNSETKAFPLCWSNDSISDNSPVSLSSAASASPFTSLDEFVTTQFLREGGCLGHINGWSLLLSTDDIGVLARSEDCLHKDSTAAKLTYQVIGNKFCRRIGRPHRSNHIMIEVDIGRGCAYQRCWDPDCRGFRSNELPVPASALPSRTEVKDALFDAHLLEFMKNNPGI